MGDNLIVWTDGGWNERRGVGYASVLRDQDKDPVVVPVFMTHADSSGCEARALALAIALTPNSLDVEIRCDSLSLIEQVSGKATCSVLELIPYVKWLRNNLGNRSLVWVSRDENKAHVVLSDIFDADDNWHIYELSALRERKRLD